jgi:hypothetical protein
MVIDDRPDIVTSCHNDEHRLCDKARQVSKHLSDGPLVSRQATFALFDACAIKRGVGDGQAARAR